MTFKSLLICTGILLIAIGYRQLAVPPDASYQELFSRAKYGVMAVVAGSSCIMLWLGRR